MNPICCALVRFQSNPLHHQHPLCSTCYPGKGGGLSRLTLRSVSSGHSGPSVAFPQSLERGRCSSLRFICEGSRGCGTTFSYSSPTTSQYNPLEIQKTASATTQDKFIQGEPNSILFSIRRNIISLRYKLVHLNVRKKSNKICEKQ